MKGIGKYIAPGLYKGDRVIYNAGRFQHPRNQWSHPAIIVGGNSERVRILLANGPDAGQVKYVSPASLVVRERWVNSAEGKDVLEKYGEWVSDRRLA